MSHAHSVIQVIRTCDLSQCRPAVKWTKGFKAGSSTFLMWNLRANFPAILGISLVKIKRIFFLNDF